MPDIKLWIVIKTPVDLDGAAEIVDAFHSRTSADAAVIGPGTYTVAEVDADRIYRTGELLDVRLIRKLDHRKVGSGGLSSKRTRS